MIDDSVLSRARTPKGKRALQAILDATYELASSEGMAAASQEAVARRAGLTQSAVRHYFPRKEDLLDAFFVAAIERMEHQFDTEFARVDKDSRWRLVIAISALGMKTQMREVLSVGFRPIALMLGETAFLAGLVLLALRYM